MEGYVSLYRKYRPKKFGDVAGHDSVKDILLSEIKSDTLPSSFLFVGQKGTGKTSTAKILAKILNCENVNKETGEACDQCENCKMANSNSHPDIIEIDAASNNGVDEIRNVKSNVFTLPVLGRKKVFIIDEVHMLTSSAFNAFLKTLEEPPTHVAFILATTEFQKIPATILSRCQVFNFKKININDLKSRLNDVLAAENLTAEDAVLNEIFYLSDGSLRDALNYLEQLSMVSRPKLTLEKMSELFSVATKNEKIKILENVFAGNSTELIAFFEKSTAKGLDVEILIMQLIDILKELIEFRITNDEGILNFLSKDDTKKFDNISQDKFFTFADVLAGVYDRTNKTNISYQYLLVSILKWISSIQNTLISVVSKNNKLLQNIHNEKDVVTKTKINEIEDSVPIIEEAEEEKTLEVEQSQQQVEEPISIEVEIKEEEAIETKKTEISRPSEINWDKNDQHNLVSITAPFQDNRIVFKKENVELNQLNVISKINFSQLEEIEFDHKKIINVLIDAKKDVRKDLSEKWEKLFSEGNEINILLTIFADAKIVGACFDAFIIYFAASAHMKIANNLFQDEGFRKMFFTSLGLEKEMCVFGVDGRIWSQIKEEYSVLKSEDRLPNFDPSLFNDFYKTVSRFSGIVTSEEDELLKRAQDFFGIEAIKVVD